MLSRIASWAVMLSGLATGLLLAAALLYFGFFALSGGLQTSLATSAPPAWALSEFEVLSGLLVLYLVAAVAFTVSLAVVQLAIGPWWAVVAGLGSLAAGAGLLIAGSQATQATYWTIDTFGFLGFIGYLVATNAVGLRARQFNRVIAGAGLAAALLLVAADVAGGAVGAGLLAVALLLYGAWVVGVGIWGPRRPARGRAGDEPLQPALQTPTADR